MGQGKPGGDGLLPVQRPCGCCKGGGEKEKKGLFLLKNKVLLAYKGEREERRLHHGRAGVQIAREER